MSILKKLLLLSLVPFLAFGIQSYRFYEESMTEARAIEAVEFNTNVFVEASILIGELQKERGKSVLYRSGVIAHSELNEQRAFYDQAYRAFDDVLSSAHLEAEVIQSFRRDMSEITKARLDVDGGLGPREVVQVYTELVDHILKLEQKIASLKKGNGLNQIMTTVILLENAKDHAGQMRSLMAMTLADQQPLTDEERKELIDLRAGVQGSFDSPVFQLNEKNAQEFKQMKASAEWQEVDRVFWQLMQQASKQDLGVDPESFFGTFSHKVDDLGLLIQHELKPLKQLASTLKIQEEQKAWINGLVFGVLAVVCSLLILILSRSILRPLRLASLWGQKVSEGDFAIDLSIKELQSKDETGEVLRSLKIMVERLQVFDRELVKLVDDQASGRTQNRLNASQFPGQFGQLAQGANAMVDQAATVERQLLAFLSALGKGDFSVQVPKFPGDRARVNTVVENVRSNLQNLIVEVDQLTEAALKGQLAKRADVTHFQGDYEKIATGLNDILDAVVRPIRQISAHLDDLSKGDLTSMVNEEFVGDFAQQKHALNGALRSLNQLLCEVAVAASQVESGAMSLTMSASTVAQGSTESAASLEQIASSMAELNSQTRHNAENAGIANQKASQARQSAQDGQKTMLQMLESMSEMEKSSHDISRIIKVIDEIAFQTNLLALNAAVEAARAGAHGKGFAVVAEEVRNLAARSAKAAKETTELIEDAIAKVHQGSTFAEKTKIALDQIQMSTLQAAVSIEEISQASAQQSMSIAQINMGINQLDAVTQQNSAVAEETSASANELVINIQRLTQELESFTLMDTRRLQFVSKAS